MMMFCLCIFFLCPVDLNQVSYAAVKWWSCWLCSRSSAPLSIAGMMCDMTRKLNRRLMTQRWTKETTNINSHSSGKTSAWLIPRRTSDFSVSTLEKMKHTTSSSSSSKLKFSLFFARICSKGRKTHTRRFFIITAYANEKMLIGGNKKKRAQLDSFAHMLTSAW